MQTSNTINWVRATTLGTSLLLAACGGGGNGGGNDGGAGDNTVGTDAGETFQVSGTVSGLSGGTVAIKNLDGAPIEVADDGSFNMNAQSRAGYQISVARNPVEQLCRVENGAASNIAGDVDNVRVICEPVASAPACTGDADSDGDSLSDCDEITRHGTNPWLTDTDGDTLADDQEVVVFDPNNNRFQFNPRVADMPTIAVDLASLPQIVLDFTETNGATRSVATGHDTSQTSGISRNWGGETSRQLEVNHTYSVETTDTVGAEVSVSLTDLGGSASYEKSLTRGYESSTAQSWGSSVNWSSEQSQENSRTYSESLELSETSGTSFNGGEMSVAARIRNNGHIPYDLENLTLSAVLFDPRRPFDVQPIGNLEFTGNGFPLTTVLPGESAPLNFSTDLLLPVAQRLLRDSRNIVIEPATFRLIDIEDRSLLLAERDVAARTATIIIDYGVSGNREEKYRVAINNGDGSKSISLLRALGEVLGLPVSQGAGQWIYGNDSAASTTATGLLQVLDVAMSSQQNQYWMIAHNRNNQASAGERVTDLYNLLVEGYDLDQIELRAGDKLTLVYVGDRDRDALSDRAEREYGTDLDLADSDGDGLSDAEEIYGWLSNLSAAPCDVGEDLTRVFSDPLLADTDADGTDDATEKAACGNPGFDFVVDAGVDQVSSKGRQVSLNATLTSTQPNQAFYTWRLVKGPAIDAGNGPTRELSGRNPSFTTPDEVSTLLFELEASVNGVVQTDQVRIQVLHDSARAHFVGADTGVNPDGSTDRPYRSIAEALAFIAPGDDLYVMTQDAPYSLTDTLSIPDGTSLFGGYDSDWVRDTASNPTPLIRETSGNLEPAVRIEQASSEMWFSGFAVTSRNIGSDAGNSIVAMQIMPAATQAGPVHITDNVITGGDVATGTARMAGSSYALMVSHLDTLRLNRNTLSAGLAGLGAAGNRGTRGVDGNDGGRGAGEGGARGAGKSGANGGTGGSWGRGPGGSGGDGNNGSGIDGFAGGRGGSGADGCTNATASSNLGKNGRSGQTPSGTHGSGGGLFDHAVTAGFVPVGGANGSRGQHGTGGGGGGGGGGCGFAGGGNGGGGGEAGTAGGGGEGGAGGGASVALWIHNVANADIRGNTIRAGNGGRGGNSGPGGFGGNGGDGGGGQAGGEACFLGACDRGGAGAPGGDGGNGGAGGRGGAGSGGPSFGIFVGADIAPFISDNDIAAGDAGNGGHFGHSGSGGFSFAVYDADPNDGVTPSLFANNLSFGSAGTAGTASSGRDDGLPGQAGTANF